MYNYSEMIIRNNKRKYKDTIRNLRNHYPDLLDSSLSRSKSHEQREEQEY